MYILGLVAMGVAGYGLYNLIPDQSMNEVGSSIQVVNSVHQPRDRYGGGRNTILGSDEGFKPADPPTNPEDNKPGTGTYITRVGWVPRQAAPTDRPYWRQHNGQVGYMAQDNIKRTGR